MLKAFHENILIIGDFVGAGMDYLGEAAVGSWEYKDYAPRFDGGHGAHPHRHRRKTNRDGDRPCDR